MTMIYMVDCVGNSTYYRIMLGVSSLCENQISFVFLCVVTIGKFAKKEVLKQFLLIYKSACKTPTEKHHWTKYSEILIGSIPYVGT